MLDETYARPTFTDDESERLPYSAAFTGSILIDADAYNGSEPLTIYNKYITNDKFANVDMSFESSNAKLYNVIIYDGDGVPFWSKKTVKNTPLDEVFLADGPNGMFDREALKKSPTAEYEYELLEKWTVKRPNQEDEDLNGIKPIGLNITTDLHIYPQFNRTRRSYDVTIKMKHPKTGETTVLMPATLFEYGSKLNEVVPADLIPYADSSNLPLTSIYDFVGYSLVEGSKTTVANTYAVNGAATLWAVFEEKDNVRKIVHPEWFSFSLLEDYDLHRDGSTLIKGLRVTPAVTLKGKVTIPAYGIYEGEELPVIVVAGFGNSRPEAVKQEVTHIFMEEPTDNKPN